MLWDNINKFPGDLRKQKQELLENDDAFGKYMKYGMSLLTDLKGYYVYASLEGKQKSPGSIFPGKLIIEDGKYRTTTSSDFLSLICSIDKGFSGLEKEKGGISAHPSRTVAPRVENSNLWLQDLRDLCPLRGIT